MIIKNDEMKYTIKIEELAMFLFSIFLFSGLDFSWWWYLVLILTPDFGMLGYVFGTKVGAITYNLFHNKAIAILLYILGIYSNDQWLQLVGIILFGHASMDRIFGYGLKYQDSFDHTHLDLIK